MRLFRGKTKKRGPASAGPLLITQPRWLTESSPLPAEHLDVPLVAGFDHADCFDNVEPLDNLAEDSITIALRCRRLMIQEAVVDGVDEKLRGGAVNNPGASHGDGAAIIFQTVVGFVFDLGFGLFGFRSASMPPGS